MPVFRESEPVVVTGVGMVTALGQDRESTWRAIQDGRSGVDWIRGLLGIPDDTLIGAMVPDEDPTSGRLKVRSLCMRAAAEAITDSGVRFPEVDLQRFGCAISAHMGDVGMLREAYRDTQDEEPWWEQFWPNTSCHDVASRFGLTGPRLSHSTACASGLISFLSAVRSIEDGQCDIALAGSGDTIDPLFLAGFNKMRVLAPANLGNEACRPFDEDRCGFVMGEGAGMFVVERLSHALERNATIYAQVTSARVLAQAHHITGLDLDCDALVHLMRSTLNRSGVPFEDVGYINAHGTGTVQNDALEARAIREVFGDLTEGLSVSATKSMLGHMINAAGSVELGITLMGMRDGIAPPTRNLNRVDPECVFDCVPWVGKPNRYQHAMKLAVAFGGHLVGIVLSRWNDPRNGFGYPLPAARAA